MKRYLYALALLVALFMASCCVCAKKQAIRPKELKPEAQVYHVDDVDLLSADIASEIVDAAWLKGFLKEKGRKPVLAIGLALNHTEEHLNLNAMKTAISKALLKKEELRFVIPPQMGQNAAGMDDYEKAASENLSKRLKEQIGADFALHLSISATDNPHHFQLNISLMDTENLKVVWQTVRQITATKEYR